MYSRNTPIDVIKGITIILVVIYHAIGISDETAITDYNNGLYNMIDCYVMQIFMVITGYLVYRHGNFDWVRRNVKRWIIPIALFTILYFVWNIMFPELIRTYELPLFKYIALMVYSGFSGIATWYLWCLCLCYISMFAIEALSRRFPKIPVMVMIVAYLAMLNVMPFNLFGMINLKWYGIFFFIGYIIRHYHDTKIVMYGGKALYGSLVAFPLVGYLTTWLVDMKWTETTVIGLAKILPAIQNGELQQVMVAFGMALLGCAFVYSVGKILSGLKPLAYIGRISIGIYLFHVMFVGITGNYWLSAAIALVISIVLYEVLRMNKAVDKYAFGSV
jgi:fucose 4-O-acetylase-like acetyltransferase